jgi:hypothetical protein
LNLAEDVLSANVSWNLRVNLPDSQKPVGNQALSPPPQRPRSRFRMALLQMAITLVVYVLSIGPLYWQWYAGKYVNGPTVIAAFYEPLWILCGWFPPLGRFVNWYVSLWIL